MNISENTEVQCPYCGAMFIITVDLLQGLQEFVEDCSICCRPVSVVVRVEDDGIIRAETHGNDE
ncbi:MAG: CPXCG motif-containing cysteine-rich protein [Chlorobi bacterium]|nr:CPXCG motif-containing cysteine-rich protein [Chlorobiota bacterium]